MNSSPVIVHLSSLLTAALAALPVHELTQVLAGLETDILRRRNVDFLVGPGVPAFARLAVRDAETAEARNRAALAALTRIGDVADECIKRRRGLLLGLSDER